MTYIVKVQKPTTKRMNPHNHVQLIVMSCEDSRMASLLALSVAPLGSRVLDTSAVKRGTARVVRA